MPTTPLEFNNKSVNDVLKTLSSGGISVYDSNLIVAGWILENQGKTTRTFTYQEPFAATSPACQPTPFTRAFVHINWVDGEDLVQAGDANGKEGFNTRFHKIESDIDRLGTNLNTSIQCLADLRVSLSKILTEIKNELNYINSHCCSSKSPGMSIDPGFYNPGYTTFPGIPFPYPNDDPRYMGEIEFAGEVQSVWNTKKGKVLLPSLPKITTDIFDSKTVKGPGRVAGLAHTNRDIARISSQAISVAEVQKSFGKIDMGGGHLLGDAIEILPQNMKYENWGAMVEDLTERTAGALRANGQAKAVLNATFGIESIGTAGSAGVENMPGLSKEASTLLATIGVSKISDLAKADVGKLQTQLENVGSKMMPGELAGFIADAKTMSKFGKF